MAPEVHSGMYGKESDIWSLGVIMYVLLTNEWPYKNGKFDYPSDLSDDCIDLLLQFIQVDKTRRINALDALHHTWIKDNFVDDTLEISDKILMNLKNYRGTSMLKRAALNNLVIHLDLD